MKTKPKFLLSTTLLCARPSAPPHRVADKGTPVTVTPEMKGAGIVSSGLALPAAAGERRSAQAGGLLGQTPLPDRHRRPAQQPAHRGHARQAHRLGIRLARSWSYYRGNEDVNFSPDGRQLAVSEEDNYDLHIVDYESRTVTWTWGVPDTRGRGDKMLNYPDDAHLLEDGKFLTADIRNCRVLIIDPKSNQIATQWGKPGQCRHDPPRTLARPNGATPMDNGDILVSEITDAWISRITREARWWEPARRTCAIPPTPSPPPTASR